MEHNLENELESELEGELESGTAHQQEAELEDELEGESEGELEDELEDESESEAEDELESEDELEGESEDELFGNLLSGASSLLGLGESEMEDEYEGELEGEEFFGSLFRGIGRFVKNHAGILKKIAKVAMPLVATAVGGPLGGKLGQFAADQINESEYEDELEGEDESEYEDELEAEQEDELGLPESEEEATAELMASLASESESESEAEAMMGGATTIILAHRDRKTLRHVIPHLVRGAAVLTRILRRHRSTRPAVRAVPTILKRTKRILARGAAAGRPVTRRRAARVMAKQTRRVLGNARTCKHTLVRSVRSVRKARRGGPRSHRLGRRTLRGGLPRVIKLKRLRRLARLRRQRGF